MSKQRFHAGDLVTMAVASGSPVVDEGLTIEAIVIESAHDLRSYALYIKDRGESAWHHESLLTLVEHGRHDLLEKWREEAEAEAKLKGDLDWIFAHGKEVIENPHHASVSTLARHLGINDLWGSMGEGFVYVQNFNGTLRLATPYLEKGDKQGWIDWSAKRVAEIQAAWEKLPPSEREGGGHMHPRGGGGWRF